MKKLLLPLVLCLSLASTAPAQEVVQALSLGTVDMTELAKLPAPPAAALEVEHEGRRHHPEHTESALAASFDFKPTAATIAVPPISTKFSVPGSSFYVPADAAGAVSRNWVVTATNNGIVVHSRGGQQQTSVSLTSFLSDIAPPDTAIYTDPRIVYDAKADRWVVWGLRFPTHGIIAISRTGDPRGEWTRYRITSSQFGQIDFTRLALTRDTIVAATYGIDGPAFQISIKKSDLYALPASLDAKIYFAPFDSVPVHGEESSVEYILSDSGSGNQIRIWRLDQLTAAPKVVTGAYPWNRAETPAPQLGSPTRRIDTGFLDIEAAVLRGGSVWAVNAAAATNPVRTYVMWWKFDPESGALRASGVLDDPTGVKFYAYPSIAVNGAGAAMIAFSTFTAATYPSTGYLYIDPTGAVSSEGLLKSGESVTNASRWGDYTTTVVDPQDDVSFWTIQLATAENHWVAWWGKMTPKSKARAARH